MSGLEEVAQGLATFLSKELGWQLRVEHLRVASAGARRRNVLFDAVGEGRVLPLVATIIPAQSIQLMGVEVEAASLRLAERAGVPVAHVHAVCSEPGPVGGPFFVTTRIEGDTIPRRVLRRVEATPGLGARLARQCGAALAHLHAADPASAHPRLTRPAQGRPVEQALVGVEALLRGLLQPSPALWLCLRWLERERPPDVEPRVIHSDLRNGNLVVSDDGLAAVLDWEGSRIGDPMEDLAWPCVRMWRFRNDSLEVGGFGTREDLRRGYEEAGGHFDEARFHWWKVLGTVRWGLGLAGQAAAHLDGSFRSIVMAGSGRRVAELEYDALMLLQGAYGPR
ncbi:MAG: phosphotransferase family protein [Myxococcota bacterium]